MPEEVDSGAKSAVDFSTVAHTGAHCRPKTTSWPTRVDSRRAGHRGNRDPLIGLDWPPVTSMATRLTHGLAGETAICRMWMAC